MSPIRTSFSSSSSSSSSYFSRNQVSGKHGPLKIWSQNLEPGSLIHAWKFNLTSNVQRKLMHNLNISGRKLLTGTFLGLSAVTAMTLNESTVAHAMDGHYSNSGEPSGFLKDDIDTFWSLARKFQLPALLLITVLMGWRHPFTLAVNVLLLLFCTKPTPLSIYMFIEQLRQRDMQKDPRWHKAKFLYAKNVTVDDYKLLCLAKAEIRDVKLDVIGILGGWWVFQTSRI